MARRAISISQRTRRKMQIQLQLQRILRGEGFKRSERICRFLSYVVEQTLGGRGDELKESLVAVKVYDRPPDYNPKIDPIVRNDARRLRAKLREYYQSEGSSDPVIIDIPKRKLLTRVSRTRRAASGSEGESLERSSSSKTS